MSEKKTRPGTTPAPAPAPGTPGAPIAPGQEQRRRQGGPPMGGPMGMMGGGEKPKDFKGSFRKLLRFLKPYSAAIVVGLLLSAGSTVFAIVGPNIMRQATNKLMEGVIAKMSGVVGATIDFEYIGAVMLTLVILYLSGTLLMALQGLVLSNVSAKVGYTLRRGISEKIGRMPLGYFDRTTHGEVLSRITNDIDTVGNTLNQSLSQIISSLATVVGVLVMMLSISVPMTVTSLLVLPISMGLVMVIVKKSQKYFRDQQEYLGHVNGHVEEMFGGHAVMKAFNGEERSIAVFEVQNAKLYEAGWKSQFTTGIMMPLMGFVGNLSYVVVCIVGGVLAIGGSLLIGDILAFIQYVRSFNQPIAQLASISNVMQQTMAAAERVFAFLEEEEEPADEEKPFVCESCEGNVDFEHVHFGYDPEKPVLRDFSAAIRPGTKVAIVGPTGAGKTTLVKLLMRFYDIQSGSIKVDGTDIRDFRREELRGLFGMVLQDTWLFNGSIRENIRYGRPGATDAEVEAAAKAAHADHFIHTQPGGYDMAINEEASNLSSGQKQLLTIARAVLADPTILILDEATSSVDTRTEVLIQKAMQSLMQCRTSFIIAHRLSTIRDADHILVMRDGDIVEQGTHESLLAARGFYHEMYSSQFETGLPESA